jgi:hypothetical protein
LGAFSVISEPAQPSILAALLIAIAPTRFDPQSAANTADVISQLRRAGYPYSTPGEFYAASMQIFTRYLILGAGIAQPQPPESDLDPQHRPGAASGPGRRLDIR